MSEISDLEHGQQVLDDFILSKGRGPSNLEELQKVIALGLLRKRLAQYAPDGSFDMVIRLRAMGEDDANTIIANLELLRPILEDYFEYNH